MLTVACLLALPLLLGGIEVGITIAIWGREKC